MGGLLSTLSGSRAAGEADEADDEIPADLMLSLPLMEPEEAARASVTMEHVRMAGPQVLRDLMEEHGFVIVTGVLSEAEVAELQAGFERDMRLALPDSIEDKATKDPLALSTHPEQIEGHFMNSMISSFGLPHTEMSWRCRIHPNVRSVYEALHPGEELCTGFDNLFFTQKGVPGAERNRRWPHVDTNKWHPTCGDWECYQGVVYLWSSEGPDCSTTVVMPRSHKDVFEILMSDPRMRPGIGLYSRIEAAEDDTIRTTLTRRFLREARRVPVPAGGLLVWSSRTMHQGWSGGPRLAQPVCWEPRSRRTPEVLVKKAKFALQGVPSTHWASLGLPQIGTGRFVRVRTKRDSGWHWLPSYAIRESGAADISDDDFKSLVARAEKEAQDEEAAAAEEEVASGHKRTGKHSPDNPATRELLGLLRPEIASVL